MTTTSSVRTVNDREHIRWTPRQREVLDLLRRGYKNAEIAEALGVSLDGAKWHVREIMSILDVESREDAAEYWREYNGLPSRFRRLVRVLVPGGAALRWLIGASAVVALAIVGSAVFLALSGGDDHQAEPVAPEESSTPPPPLTATADTSLSAVPSAVTPAGDVALQVGMQGLLGFDTVAYTRTGCYACGDGVGNLERWRVGGDGRPERRELFTFDDDYPGGYVHTFAADWDHGRFAVGICTEAYCGGEGAPTTDAPLQVLESRDGGITWQHAGQVPTGTWFLGYLDGEILASTWDGSKSHFSLFPSGRVVTPPGEDQFPEIVGGEVYWTSN